MSGTDAAALAGIPNRPFSQVIELDQPYVVKLAAVFPRPSAIEDALRALLAATNIDSPTEDGRDFASQIIAVRRGQGHFRDDLIRQYDGRCCITGTSVRATELEGGDYETLYERQVRKPLDAAFAPNAAALAEHNTACHWLA